MAFNAHMDSCCIECYWCFDYVPDISWWLDILDSFFLLWLDIQVCSSVIWCVLYVFLGYCTGSSIVPTECRSINHYSHDVSFHVSLLCDFSWSQFLENHRKLVRIMKVQIYTRNYDCVDFCISENNHIPDTLIVTVLNKLFYWYFSHSDDWWYIRRDYYG